jgi:pyridinium-3,5-biscarboxylic acid mononucleotide sulfurtransferase
MFSSQENLDQLVNWFRGYKSCIVAFSAGVDSSLLALAAKKAIGYRAYAVTSISPAFASSELEVARRIAKEIGIELFEVYQDDLNDQNYTKNEVSRCYFCRTNLASAIAPLKSRLSIDICVDGTHLDDLQKPRPGVKALREKGFRAPLAELGFSKTDVRQMARFSGLSNWDKPSEACLSSRVAYGQEISQEVLERVENAENTVRSLTGAKIVRVRIVGNKAVVEVDSESVDKANAETTEIRKILLEQGFSTVEIDQRGYVSGRMLELFVNNTEV